MFAIPSLFSATRALVAATSLSLAAPAAATQNFEHPASIELPFRDHFLRTPLLNLSAWPAPGFRRVQDYTVSAHHEHTRRDHSSFWDRKISKSEALFDMLIALLGGALAAFLGPRVDSRISLMWKKGGRTK